MAIESANVTRIDLMDPAVQGIYQAQAQLMERVRALEERIDNHQCSCGSRDVLEEIITTPNEYCASGD